MTAPSSDLRAWLARLAGSAFEREKAAPTLLAIAGAVLDLADELEREAAEGISRWANRQESLAKSSALGIFTGTGGAAARLRAAAIEGAGQ